MTGEQIECVFCKKNFAEQSEFWTHMTKGCFQEDSAHRNDVVIPKPPARSNFRPDERNPQPSAVNCPEPTVLPTSPDTPPGSKLSSSETNSSQNNLFSNEGLPNAALCTQSGDVPSKGMITEPVHTYSTSRFSHGNHWSPVLHCPTTDILPQQPSPKWRCTLCNIEFAEKAAMISHIKTPEHESKIPSYRPPKNVPLKNNTLPEVKSKTTPLSPSIIAPKRSDLAEIVREIINEELPAILRRELRSMLEALLKTNDDEPRRSPPRATPTPSSPVETFMGSKYIRKQGPSIRCDACECLLTSMANLALHVEGKRHKANVAKLDYRMVS